jgi:hypothetical protein
MTDKLLEAHRGDLEKMLWHTGRLFGAIAKEAQVWVALRALNEDGEYETILRTPNCHSLREENSDPLPADCMLVQALHAAYLDSVKADCVILTGPSHQEWLKMTNDQYQENKSVLLGAIYSKSWNEGVKGFRKNHKLTWILCVNADKENAFSEHHKPLMRCCNDAFSMLVNVLSRYSPTSNSPKLLVDSMVRAMNPSMESEHRGAVVR